MAFNPEQPRDESGRWGAVGRALLGLGAAAAGIVAVGVLSSRPKFTRVSPTHAISAALHAASLAGRVLSSHETSAITEYSKLGYKSLNAGLRSGSADHRLVSALDSAVSKAHLPDHLVLYRGIDKKISGSLKPGAIISDKAFQSTALDRKYARTFAKGGNLVHIYAPKGSRALPLNGVSAAPEEHEVLLPRNSRYRVLRVRGTDVHAELLS